MKKVLGFRETVESAGLPHINFRIFLRGYNRVWQNHSTAKLTWQFEPLRLSFFDLEAIIHSDSDRYLNLFHQMYRRFRLDEHSSPPRSTVKINLLTQPNNPWGKPVLIIDDEVRFLNTSRLLEGYVYETVFHTIISRVTSHYLIHAGVVAYNDQGIILSADSGHGKTTLVLELVRRGFKFLSDEMAALSRTDHLIYPFPRSLRIRAGTLERAGFSTPKEDAPKWLGKWILDIDEIKANSLGDKTSLNYIIILRDPAQPQHEPENILHRELGILVDRIDAAFLDAIRHIEGISDIKVGQNYGYPLLTLYATDRAPLLSKVEALCHEQQVLILEVIKRREEHPSFDFPVRLEKIPQSQGAMELVRRFQGGHKSALLRQVFQGSSTRLFVELATIIERANCYQLFVGNLPDMADRVCQLVGAI